MKVYIVVRQGHSYRFGYSSAHLFSVYRSKHRAEAAIKRVAQKDRDNYYVVTRSVRPRMQGRSG
jgi:hypothetical protein